MHLHDGFIQSRAQKIFLGIRRKNASQEVIKTSISLTNTKPSASHFKQKKQKLLREPNAEAIEEGVASAAEYLFMTMVSEHFWASRGIGKRGASSRGIIFLTSLVFLKSPTRPKLS
jgi:hypothetical protein